ncbi:hypothetical protein [Gloeobacter kilaueensis]|uniref:Uncharacterized protein n=1 Tax=Gloeobacter kilaueensis (strain ATCC BAA-2537 / CCAP 1431/1 / ULC 316 / JS1) TaxID=1183438 RepID=U5QHT2_GLOK1|nr:hypothetical protein [Gloeobacter kilaueensis]AGY58423.1 hypothetical protein GKIL_2177 [Gloeobacter kilaueensis JS1]
MGEWQVSSIVGTAANANDKATLERNGGPSEPLGIGNTLKLGYKIRSQSCSVVLTYTDGLKIELGSHSVVHYANVSVADTSPLVTIGPGLFLESGLFTEDWMGGTAPSQALIVTEKTCAHRTYGSVVIIVGSTDINNNLKRRDTYFGSRGKTEIFDYDKSGSKINVQILQEGYGADYLEGSLRLKPTFVLNPPFDPQEFSEAKLLGLIDRLINP